MLVLGHHHSLLICHLSSHHCLLLSVWVVAALVALLFVSSITILPDKGTHSVRHRRHTHHHGRHAVRILLLLTTVRVSSTVRPHRILTLSRVSIIPLHLTLAVLLHRQPYIYTLEAALISRGHLHSTSFPALDPSKSLLFHLHSFSLAHEQPQLPTIPSAEEVVY